MELLLSYFVVYLGSYGILVTKHPLIAKDVSLLDITWMLSKGTNELYLGWLLAGNFKSLTKGSWVYWLLQASRAYIIILLILLLRELYDSLKSTV